ncbi:hypothetical protein NSK_000329, partial [Nannochloropsis salina CCMP1776]
VKPLSGPLPPTSSSMLSTIPSPSGGRGRRKENKKERARSKAKEKAEKSAEEKAEELQALLASPIDLRKAPDISVDPSAFRVSELTPLSDVYALFDLIRCNRVFVVSYGVLVGVISRRILIDNISRLNQEPQAGHPPLLFNASRAQLTSQPSLPSLRRRQNSITRQRSNQSSYVSSHSSGNDGATSVGPLRWVQERLGSAGKKREAVGKERQKPETEGQ